MALKILFVSMDSIHAKRWIENLNGTEFELFWFDILNRGSIDVSDKINQIVNWKKRKIKYIKGEYFFRKKFPSIYLKILPFLEVTIEEQFEIIIKELNPDIVHSFEMQGCSYPILNTMLKFPELKWIYSCWGSDLYYFKNNKKDYNIIKKVLSRVNFIFTDCFRDYNIAKKIGFNGSFLGVIPGGGGFDLPNLKKYKQPLNERKIILIKGYEHKFGRALNVIKAIQNIKSINNFNIIIFGAHQIVIDYINNNNLPYKCFDRHELSHIEVLKLMGNSILYIGNSISDGLPNTLLEAIIMNAYPIQSNPGGVTEEIIENEKTGLLINNPNNISEIKFLIEKALNYYNENKLEKSAELNNLITLERLDYKVNKKKIINIYKNFLKE